MRVIKIVNDIIIEVKNLGDNYTLQENEFFSEIGELGQQKLTDGSFIDVEQEKVVLHPSIEEKMLVETQYQTILLEMNTLV